MKTKNPLFEVFIIAYCLPARLLLTLMLAGGLPIAYCFAQGTWTPKADFGGTGRWGAVGFSIGNKGYIGTGWDNGPHQDFWEYNPSTDAWTQKANFGGTARYGAVGFSIGNKGYIGTGGAVDLW